MLHEYVNELQKRTFEIHNSSSFSSSQAIHNDFQDLQFASNGAFGNSLKNSRVSKVSMMASGGGGGGGKSPIFDIATAKLDGTAVNKLGDLIKGKKAVLIVNVASK